MKHKLWLQLLVIYTRYAIGGAFVFASLIKIKGERFTTESGANEAINTSWHFFETMYQSGLYWQFIGFGQLFAGFLLMTQRFAKLGAMLNLPILCNIFVITLSYYFAFTPVIVGLMLVANIGLFFWDWNELKILFNLPYKQKIKTFENDIVWQIIGLMLFLFTFFYRLFVDKYDAFFWLSICFIIGIIGLVFGLKKYKKQRL